MPARRRKENEVVGDKREQMIAEQRMEIDRLRDLCDATRTLLEQEKMRGPKKRQGCWGRILIRHLTEMTGVVRIEQLRLNNGR